MKDEYNLLDSNMLEVHSKINDIYDILNKQNDEQLLNYLNVLNEKNYEHQKNHKSLVLNFMLDKIEIKINEDEKKLK